MRTPLQRHGSHEGHDIDMDMQDTEAGHGSEADGHAGHETEPTEPASEPNSGAHHAHGEHGAAGAMAAEETVPASLLLHVAPPAPGTYALWIQFMGDGEVRTPSFMISVR
jgi:hypothetical protein